MGIADEYSDVLDTNIQRTHLNKYIKVIIKDCLCQELCACLDKTVLGYTSHLFIVVVRQARGYIRHRWKHK